VIKVHIKYNPYKLETFITVQNRRLAQNSRLAEKAAGGCRMQEWVEELPSILVDEYNDREFELTFHGTLLDFEDLVAVVERSTGDEFGAQLFHIPAKETIDREVLIEEVFKEIKKGPFAELNEVEILSAFEHAKSSDFEVCVVATMSAGQSTLINALLGTKLMPSKQEACTGIITRIKDNATESSTLKAEVFRCEERQAETYENLTYPIMERLNADENVSVIHVSGNIPFVSSEDVSLVLINTPGPNNASDKRHNKIQSELLKKSSKALVLYIMTGEFGTDDDNALLNRVAESMKDGGKQSKDRFLFVVNKLDDRKPEDGDTDQTLARVRAYLKTHGISDPNLFPAAALPALNIRLIQSGADVDEETRDDTEVKIKKLNRTKRVDAHGQPLAPLHFEKYASLPRSLQKEINEQLHVARVKWQGKEHDNPDEALIHTGIVSIEAAIRQHVQKYAKTAKIKNIVDTFTHKIEEVGCFEKTKSEIAHNATERNRIAKSIEIIKEKMANAKDAKKLKLAVDHAIVRANDKSSDLVEEVVRKLQNRTANKIQHLRGRELSVPDAKSEVKNLIKFAKQLETDFEVELDEPICNHLAETSIALLEDYKNRLSSLTDELDIANFPGVTIDPLKLMGGSVSGGYFSVRGLIQTRTDQGEELWIPNPDKTWPSPWTLFEDDFLCVSTESTRVRFIDGDELATEFFNRVKASLSSWGIAACEYALEHTKCIEERFSEEFARLDDILRQKLSELERFASDKAQADARYRESVRRMRWLESIKEKLEVILEV